MDRFERAMIKEGIPQEVINLIKLSPTWIKRFKTINLDEMIYLFPKIYTTLNTTLNTTLDTLDHNELAKINYMPMDI